MSLQTLKELLNQPFEVFEEDDGDFVICDSNRKKLLRLANNYFEKHELEAAEFISAALNEKWERDFGERKRWIIKGDGFNVDPYLVCPKCNEEPGLFWDGEACDNLPNYCPNCGQRLLPPEKTE